METDKKQITFFAPGCPITKGSGHALIGSSGKPFVVQNNARRLGPWEARIASLAREAGAQGIASSDGAYCVQMAFKLKRPKSHMNSHGELLKSAPRYPVVRKADLDKLERATLDALSGEAFNDDSQVVRIESEKTYCSSSEAQGVWIGVVLL